MRHGSLVATRGVAEKAGTQISKKTPKRSLFLVRRLGLVVEKRDVLPPERDELVVSAAGAPHVEAIVVIKQGGKTVLQDIWQQVLEMLDVGQYQRRDPDRELFSENRPIKFAIQVSRHAGAHQRIFKADHHGENNAPFPLGQPADRLALEQSLDAPAELGDALAAVIVAGHEFLLDVRFELTEAAAQFRVGSEPAAFLSERYGGGPVEEAPAPPFPSVRKRGVLKGGPRRK